MERKPDLINFMVICEFGYEVGGGTIKRGNTVYQMSIETLPL